MLNHIFIGNPASKNLIIFLHEGLGSITQWKEFPIKACEITNAYGLVYDRAGYGKSNGSLANRKSNYLHLAAIELDEVIESIAPNNYNLFLYGHSDGGSIALIYAALYPNKITGIITEAAHVFVEKVTISGIKATLPLFLDGKFDGLRKHHGNRYEEVFWAWYKTWLSTDFLDWDITPILSYITCKQLIIQGEKDQYATLKQVDTIAESTIGKSKIFIPKDCFHAPHKENEKMTLLQLYSFLNSF